MSNSDSHYEPLTHLVRQLKPFKMRDYNFEFVDKDRLMVLAANVYMLRAITSMWRNALSQNYGKTIDVYSDDMLAYEICQSIAFLYSDKVEGNSDYATILKVKKKDTFDFKVFEALSDYLDLLQETRDIGNDIWKRAMGAIYNVCFKSEACRSAAQAVCDHQMKIDSRHWSVELISDLAE